MISIKFLCSLLVISFYVTIAKAWETLKVIEFEAWNEVKLLNKTKMPSIPVHVILSRTMTESCYTLRHCKKVLNSEKMPEMIPSFYIDGDGQIYVGHGWDFDGGVNLCSNEGGKTMIEISFIGTFAHSKIPTKQLRAAQELLDRGISTGKLSSKYYLYGEWQLIKEYYPIHEDNKKIFRTWPHWAKDLSQCSFHYPLYYDDNDE